MNIIILILGFLFGVILMYSKLNRYNVISGLAMRTNLAVAKAIAVAIGIGAILIITGVFMANTYHLISGEK